MDVLKRILAADAPLPAGLVSEMLTVISLTKYHDLVELLVVRPEVTVDHLITLAESYEVAPAASVLAAITSRPVNRDQLARIIALAKGPNTKRTMTAVLTEGHVTALLAPDATFEDVAFLAHSLDPKVAEAGARRVIEFLNADPETHGVAGAQVYREALSRHWKTPTFPALLLEITDPATLGGAYDIARDNLRLLEHVMANSDIRSNPKHQTLANNLERALADLRAERDKHLDAERRERELNDAVAALPPDLDWKSFLALVMVSGQSAGSAIATAADALRPPAA